jgi:adenine-specific DNA methylase
MTNDNRLIEDYIPIEAISAEARREKSIRKGHISTLHLWWARRPLVAARAAGSIHLTVEAHKPEGFDPGWLQNAVLEPLDESDVEVEENRENGQKET